MLRQKAWVGGVLLAVFLLADAALFLSVLTAPRPISSALLPTAEYLEQNPTPTPEFIERVEVAPCWNITLCLTVEIRERPFARAGISADELTPYLFKNSIIQVDGHPLIKSMESPSVFTCDTSASSGDASQAICWGLLTIHVDISDISSGLHLASITIPDLDGVEHSYSWAFRYDPNFPTADPNILPTLARLPTETPTP